MPRTVNAPNCLLRRKAFTPQAIARYGTGHATLGTLATAAGIDPTTLKRAYNGTISPGERVVNALLDYTGQTYENLFDRVTRTITIPTPGDDDYDPGDWPPGRAPKTM